jgi:outer membrane biosynthesis protein TonB
MPENEISHIFIIAKYISNALLKALDVRGTNIIVANGAAAGQRAQHFMIHIIPRKEGDGVEFTLPFGKFSEEDLDSVAATVKKKLSELIGIKEKPKTAEDILRENARKKVVEAEFKEEKRQEIPVEKPIEKKVEKPEEKKEVKEEKKKEEKESSDKDEDDEDSDELDLDSIAKVLHGR